MYDIANSYFHGRSLHHPAGTYYSPLVGDCQITYVCNLGISISPVDEDDFSPCTFSLDEYGRLSDTGECLLFPSASCRSWEAFAAANN